MNKTSSYSYTVKQIIKYMNNGRMNFDFPIQRESGQWNKKQKSLLIHSILQGYDVPDIYIINEGTSQYEKDSVLDGKQRCTTLKEFYDDGFAMAKDAEPIVLDGKGYEVAGKKYSNLDPEVQDEFLDYNIRARKMNGFTDKEIEEQFFRLNNGSTFTAAQKANVRLGTDIANAVSEIANSSFFKFKATFSKKQRTSGEVINCVLQTMMLMSKYPFKGISNKDIFEYAETISMQYENGEFDTTLLADCKHAAERLYAIIIDLDVKGIIKKAHIPSLLCNMVTMEGLEESGDINDDLYREFLAYWFSEGMLSEEYKSTCGRRSSGRANAIEKVTIINNALLNFICGKQN